MREFLDGRTILVVDDEIEIRFYLKEILEQVTGSVRVIAAGNGQEAMDQVKNHPPDLVILDLNMPVMTGYEFLSRFRAIPDHETVPVLVLTAHTDNETMVEVLDSGASDFMTKPLNRMAVLARLRSLILRKERVEKLHQRILQQDLLLEVLRAALDDSVGPEQRKKLEGATTGVQD